MASGLAIYFPYISDTVTNGTWGNSVVTAHLGVSYNQARPIATSEVFFKTK